MNKYIYEMFLNENKNNYYNPQEIYDNKIEFQNSKNYFEENNNILGINMDLNNNILNSNQKEMFNNVEGFEKGNIFKNLYDPYKNYIPRKLNPENEEQDILLKIDQLSFAMHEINLYLNNFPEDKGMINNYNSLQNEYNKLLNYYESNYTPLQSNNPYMTSSPFIWTEDVWPWDRRVL